MAQLAQDFMSQYTVPGLSIAIGEYGTPVYAKAFGVADRTSKTRLTTDHRLRIASVTKPITATAIFQLIERGGLSLDDRVFGPGAVLGTTYGGPPYQNWVSDIRIWHLLTHTCGGWDDSGATPDPMFINLQMDQTQLIEWTLASLPLAHEPGTTYAYSNFGYCVLGRVIETATEIVRTSSRFSWAVFTNTRVPSSNMFIDLDSLPWKMAQQVKSWNP